MRNKILLAALLLFPTIVSAEHRWLPKPVLCGLTEEILSALVNDEFVRVAKSNVIKNAEDTTVIGEVLYLMKDDDIFIVENFHITKISCVIGMYKNFILTKKKETDTY